MRTVSEKDVARHLLYQGKAKKRNMDRVCRYTTEQQEIGEQYKRRKGEERKTLRKLERVKREKQGAR